MTLIMPTEGLYVNIIFFQCTTKWPAIRPRYRLVIFCVALAARSTLSGDIENEVFWSFIVFIGWFSLFMVKNAFENIPGKLTTNHLFRPV